VADCIVQGTILGAAHCIDSSLKPTAVPYPIYCFLPMVLGRRTVSSSRQRRPANFLNLRRNHMKLQYRYLCSIVLTAALVTAPFVSANSKPQDDRRQEDQSHSEVNKRVYDKEHKDYHNWDAKEDQSWRQYQSDQHKDYRDFSKANKKEQSQYWNWRHAHPDGDQH
jgi:hypothetical protein